jgi:hydroxymethylpyrimidine/phosphomethylpyrimidine kinase
MARLARALTIAGSDSGGGAGIQADLKTFAALGVYGASVLTAVTAQDTRRVYSTVEMEPAFVAAQIDAVLGDIGADAVKTGMLVASAVVDVVVERLERWEARTLVVDPVMRASSGDALGGDDILAILREKLLPLALVVTPNLPEAELLTGHTIETWDDIRAAAREIHAMGAANVVIKGGHQDDPQVTDLLFDGRDFREFSARRVTTGNTHGTGCTFSAAITASLAKGESVTNSVLAAKAYITKALQNSYPIGSGHGPVHHFYRFWQPRAVS